MAGFIARISSLFRNSRSETRRSVWRLCEVQSLETRRLLAADFQLVKDINPRLTPDSARPSEFVSINSTLFFLADSDSGSGLWKTDGTVAGTQQIKSVNSPSNLTNVGGTLFFAAKDWADDGTSIGRELWKSDGTEAGTVMVKDINQTFHDDGDSSPSSLTNVGGVLYFTANDGTHGHELWKSDGTTEGTLMLKDLFPGSYLKPVEWPFLPESHPNSSVPSNFTNANGTLYFFASDGTSGRELWKSDGTAVGTLLVKDIFPGTHVGTQYMSDYQFHEVDVPNDSDPENLTVVNGTLFFTANDGTAGEELWKSDGSAVGTTLVRNIRSGAGSASPAQFTAVGKSLYFTANDGVNGTELWKSDGSIAGTVIVKDIRPGTGSSNPANLTNVNGALYFSATDGLSGTELWKTNGTAAGTVIVKDILVGAESATPKNLKNIGGTLYFSANDGTSGAELWKSDGTLSGTQLVKDIQPGNKSSEPSQLTIFNGTLYLAADNGANGVELWKSDGTAAGTTLINVDPENGNDSGPDSFARIGSLLYFSANDGSHGAELWKSDGTATGTVLVKNIRGGSAGSDPSDLTAVGGTLFFTANDGSHGVELWRSDGTPAGTFMVRDILVGSGSAEPANLTNVNGSLYFTANDGADGKELWKTDGTIAGTVMVKSLAGGKGSVEPSYLVNFAGVLYFTANDTEFWKSNGTASGTEIVKDVRSFVGAKAVGDDGMLYFLATGTDSRELWKSNGTAAGTVLVKDDIGQLFRGYEYVILRSGELLSAGGILYFTAYTRDHGEELWRSNGTSAGTAMVKDINTGYHEIAVSADETLNGPNGSSPSSFTKFGNELYFVANDDTDGRQIWKTNGTTEGTVRVSENMRPLYRYATSPLQFVANKLYAGIATESFGAELYVTDLTQGTTGSDQYTLTYIGQGPQAEVLVTLSSNGGPVATLGKFSTAVPLSLNGLSGNDSVRIVGTRGRDILNVTSSGLSFNGHKVILNGIENRTLVGAGGDDEYRFDADAPLGLFTLNESGGGRDTLSFAETTTKSVNVNLGSASVQVVNSNLSLSLGSASTFEDVNGGAQSDKLIGNSLGNTLRGNNGSDLFNGAGGSDALLGGLGDDTYQFSASAASESDRVFELTAQGTDTLSFEALTSDLHLNLGLSTPQLVHTNRTLTLNSVLAFERARGGSGNDMIVGNPAGNVLYGVRGHDVLNGTLGNDVLIGGIGDDTYVFGSAAAREVDTVTEMPSEGTDTLTFSSQKINVTLNLSQTTAQRVHTNRTLTLSSGSAIENANGGSGNDNIVGNALNNTLQGNSGNDVLNGTLGSDRMLGGFGDDLYAFGSAVPGEVDIVTELPSQGIDTLTFSSQTSSVQLNLGLTTSQVVHTNRSLTLTSGSTIERASGGSGNDMLFGNALDNLLIGNGGNDILVGNSGNDRLQGRAGRDLLIGGLGRDTLEGGTEDDILIAGRTTNDGLTANLNTVRLEWTSSRSYASRVSRLRAGVGSPVVSLKARTNVLNDAGDDDSVSGGAGSDWYFRALDDAILDLATGELVDLL